MSFPILSEIWMSFHLSLQIQAKRLVEDIAKQNNSDPKLLWAEVSSLLQTPIVSSDLDDPVPTLCSFYTGIAEGAIYPRCRAPCLLGFSSCVKHNGLPIHPISASLDCVKRFIDSSDQKSYFIDSFGTILDKNGSPVGEVIEEEYFLWEL